MGGVGGWVGASPTHVRTHTHARARTYAHHACMLNMINHGCLHGGGHLQFSNMFIFAFRACACVHVCMCTRV